MQPVFLAVFGCQEASFKHEVKVDHSMMFRYSLKGANVGNELARA